MKGKSLHSGKFSTVKLNPEIAGAGRFFEFRSRFIPASIEFAQESPLCTTLLKDELKIRTVEHLLSALEAKGVDNCRIQIESESSDDREVEVCYLNTYILSNHRSNQCLVLSILTGFVCYRDCQHLAVQCSS